MHPGESTFGEKWNLDQYPKEATDTRMVAEVARLPATTLHHFPTLKLAGRGLKRQCWPQPLMQRESRKPD